MANAAAVLDVRTVTKHLDVLLNKFDVLVDYLAMCYVTWRHNPQKPVAAEPAMPDGGGVGAGATAGLLAALKAKSGAVAVVSPFEAAKSKVTVELHAYATAAVAATSGLADAERLAFDSLGWWRTNQSQFPYLAHAARSLLAMQATSAASERMFSSAGFVSNPTRNRLSPDTLELCVLVTSALRNGIDLREGVRRLKEEKKTGANAKRSASMKAVRAAKKAKATAAAAVSEEIVLDEDEDGEDDDGDEEGPRAAELELAVKVAALLAEEEAGEW